MAEQLVADKEIVDRAIEDDREVITVPTTIAAKLGAVTDVAGNALQSISQFESEWSASIEYHFVSERDLTPAERAVYEMWRDIANLAGGVPREFKSLMVSETMRPSATEGLKPGGFWEPTTGRVIVHRPQLRSVEAFAGTLLHELTHARDTSTSRATSRVPSQTSSGSSPCVRYHARPRVPARASVDLRLGR